MVLVRWQDVGWNGRHVVWWMYRRQRTRSIRSAQIGVVEPTRHAIRGICVETGFLLSRGDLNVRFFLICLPPNETGRGLQI